MTWTRLQSPLLALQFTCMCLGNSIDQDVRGSQVVDTLWFPSIQASNKPTKRIPRFQGTTARLDAQGY